MLPHYTDASPFPLRLFFWDLFIQFEASLTLLFGRHVIPMCR